jgi:hypothetical protein
MTSAPKMVHGRVGAACARKRRCTHKNYRNERTGCGRNRCTFTTHVRKNLQIAIPLAPVGWRIGQRVYFVLRPDKSIQISRGPKGSFYQGKLQSTRIRRLTVSLHIARNQPQPTRRSSTTGVHEPEPHQVQLRSARYPAFRKNP